ncbi:MAG: CIA30 family protein, partial [Planctomycetota bacterium]
MILLIPILPLIAMTLLPGTSPPDPLANDAPATTKRLFDFSDPDTADSWRTIDDVVMGGVSSSRVLADPDGKAVFTGTVSLERNGGFASARAPASLATGESMDGIALDVRGDGKIYKVSLRGDRSFDGVGYQASFATVADRWTTVTLPLEAFTPSWRGRLVTDAPPFDPSRLQSIGLSISDKQAGVFRLEVRSISAWRRAEPRAGRTALLQRLDAGPGANELRAALRNTNRLLIVSAPSSLDADASIQLGRLLARNDQLEDRDLLVLELYGTRSGRLAGRTLGPDLVRGLRGAFELAPGAWQAALVGKDGGVKHRWSEPFDPDDAFGMIDAMPMRIREVSQRRLES